MLRVPLPCLTPFVTILGFSVHWRGESPLGLTAVLDHANKAAGPGGYRFHFVEDDVGFLPRPRPSEFPLLGIRGTVPPLVLDDLGSGGRPDLAQILHEEVLLGFELSLSAEARQIELMDRRVKDGFELQGVHIAFLQIQKVMVRFSAALHGGQAELHEFIPNIVEDFRGVGVKGTFLSGPFSDVTVNPLASTLKTPSKHTKLLGSWKAFAVFKEHYDVLEFLEEMLDVGVVIAQGRPRHLGLYVHAASGIRSLGRLILPLHLSDDSSDAFNRNVFR